MGEGFIKQKKKALQSAIIKSAVCGLSFGLFAVGIVLLALKLSAIKLFFVYYILIAIGAALLCAGLTFLIFRPVDKRLAVELDNKYGLQEKVQTALAFANESGSMIEMQRSDANARLNALPKDKFDISKVWQYFLIALLSVAILFTALFVPAKIVEGGTVDTPPDTQTDTPFAVSDEQLAALDTLIENINDCALDSDVKASAVSIISGLKDELKSVEWVSEMRLSVKVAAIDMDNLISALLTYKVIANSLAAYNHYAFADVVANGVKVYRENTYHEYSDVTDFLENLASEEIVPNAIGELIKTTFDALEEDEDFSNTLSEFNVALREMTDVNGIPDDDGLYKVFKALANDFADEEKSFNLAYIIFDEDVCPELENQAYISALRNYILYAICDPFDAHDLMPGDPEFLPSAEDNPGNNEEGNNQGGYGDGSLRGGSDDLIYDPITGEYVRYIEILARYEALVDSMLREGQLTDEQMKVIRAYFDILRQYVAE